MKESKSAVMFAIVAVLILTGSCVVHDATRNLGIFIGVLLIVVGVFFFGFTCGELNQSRGRQTNGKT